MRTWIFGQNPGQFADWHANTIYIRSPYGPWGDTILQEFVSGINDDNERQTIGWYGSPGSNSQHKYVLMKILMNQVRAKLGQIPIIIQCNFVCALINNNNNLQVRVYRLISDWSLDNVTNRYKDKTGLVTWDGDAWFPWWGSDVEEDYIASTQWSSNIDGLKLGNRIDVKPIIEKSLRDNTDAMLYFEGYNLDGNQDLYWNWRDNAPNNPYLEFTYIYPIEFYAPLINGDIDLLAPMDDTLGNEYYLGAVERGETGQAVKGWVRNYSGATAHLDIWDDYPDVTQPSQVTGPGTGSLDYAEAGEPAVSQRYTVVFYSATQFEVKAESYRENPVNLHPAINGDVAWRGNINADFNAPLGGMKIPAAGWQPGTQTTDEIQFNVRGNTTDTAWPADSNDQVEMTFDITGNPDSGNWRPITARRARVASTVTIDAVTKFVPVRYIDPADWPIGNRAFIMNEVTIDECVIQSAQQPSIGVPAFTGGGLDDLTVAGNFNGNAQSTVRVRIDGTGTPDTFEYSLDGGSTYQPGLIPITGSAQLLDYGVWITFAATTGHTISEYWDIAVEPFGVTLAGLSITSNGYGSGALVATSLPFRDVESVPYSVVSQACGTSFPPASRLYVEDPSAFSAGMEILIQKSGTAIVGESSELATIAPGGVNIAGGYVDLTAVMTLNYAIGDFVGATETGHRAFWMRTVATPITVEELKRFRLNAKIY
jgi:hypothetical protein